MFGSKSRISKESFDKLKESFDKLKGQVETITRILTYVKEKHFEFDESLEIIMKMLADGENNSNARYIATERKLIIFEKIIRENKLDKERLLDTIVN